MIEPLEPVENHKPCGTSSIFHGARLSTRILPAALSERGGDWCETFAVSDDVIALSIGDVCGHGPEKFDAMTELRRVIREGALRGNDPARSLAAANRFLRRFDPEENATAVLAFLNVPARSLVFANAGHPPPLMVGPLGSLFLEFPGADLPLGVQPEIDLTQRVINLPAATLLVLYTDGVTERERKPLQAQTQLREVARYAYRASRFSAASVIGEKMRLGGWNIDDAAILTIWTPFSPVMRESTTCRTRSTRFGERRAWPRSSADGRSTALEALADAVRRDTWQRGAFTAGE